MNGTNNRMKCFFLSDFGTSETHPGCHMKIVYYNLTCCAIIISMRSFWCKSPKCPYIYLKIKILENKLLNFSNITGFSKNTIEGHT